MAKTNGNDKSKSKSGVKNKRRALSPAQQVRFEKRCTAVDAVCAGQPVAAVAKVLNVSTRVIFLWLERYRHGGYDALREGDRSGRKRKVTGEVMRWLYDAISRHDPRQYQFPFCLWTLAVVRTLLKRKFGIDLSKSGVSRLLGHLGFSSQRPIYRSYKRDPKKMKAYLQKTFPGSQEQARRIGAVIYFVDESAVRSDSHRGATWGFKGQTPEVEDSGDRFSLKLISAVSPRGDMRFQCFEGRMNGPRFVEFLKKLHADTGGPIIVIADNASYHRSGPVKSYMEQSEGQVVVEHLPAYYPDLNPDEQVWNHAKRRLGKLFLANKYEFKAALFSIMISIQRTRELVRSFFRLPGTRYAAEAC